MDYRTQHRLAEETSKNSTNTDTYLKIDLSSKELLLPPDEINQVVNVADRFYKEKQESTFYRIVGTINPIVSNVLFNITGDTSDTNNYKNSWTYLNDPIFKGDSLTFDQSIQKNLKEIEGWYGYFDPLLTASTFCNFYDMEPKRERFSFIPDITNNTTKNWELTVTYPYTADTTHLMINGGLIIVDKRQITIGGRNLVAIGTPVMHNLKSGDTVRLTNTGIDDDYLVVMIGLENGDLKNYYFCLEVDFSLLTIGPSSRMNRMVNTRPSEYYFRKFKKIKTRYTDPIETDDYEVYNLAFSETIYFDKVTQFVFNEDVNVSDLKDNLGRPLSELYLTVIKTNSNGIFTNISSGIEAPQIDNFNDPLLFINQPWQFINSPIIQKIHNGGAGFPSFRALETGVTINNTDYYGDVVEYNAYEVKEVILSDVFYRFNTNNRQGQGTPYVSGPRPEGYYYKPHHLMKIRDYSNYIEQGDNTIEGIPDYAQDLGDGRYLWRDLLDIGLNESDVKALDYPFLNGCHYLYQNYCFDVRRQDPFGFWQLHTATFPPDPVGNSVSNQFIVNETDDVC